ncbi:hypothetical protein GWJ07_12370 [Proteus sp. G2639]|uniref:hypothetical protein n=1 Tax=unclassified Proteus (in: enterobacteria) TaxID=257482 RepID=UPI0013781B7B|nr:MULTISPECIES: hypothetical protein [unclassified Proteus (in: enterobacteria)]NBM90457.1 hypothetical protein [Proteus sp. G2658]NBN60407.1 hypothetical protein [Proteus sp. G2639]NBN75353.1 hypothetical protein [Proteus sp. G2615]
MNKKYIVLSIFIVISIIFFYFISDIFLTIKDNVYFNKYNISHWSNLSIILSPVLTFVSIVTLLVTAIIMHMGNKESIKQYKEQKRKQEEKDFINEITLLINTINNIIKNNTFPSSDGTRLNITQCLSRLRFLIDKNFEKQEVNNSDIILEYAVNYYATKDMNIFDGLSQMFFVLLKSINQIEKNNKIHQIAKSMVLGCFDNELRFMIACYMYSKRTYPEIAKEVDDFYPFYEIPEFCEKLVTPSESEEKAMDAYRNGELS